ELHHESNLDAPPGRQPPDLVCRAPPTAVEQPLLRHRHGPLERSGEVTDEGQGNISPAMDALSSVAVKPTKSARIPRRARSCRRSGAIAPIPPSWMPTEAKLAKPVRAKAASLYDRSLMNSGMLFQAFICK